MKILFVHDHIFRKIGNAIYSSGGLNNGALERYTEFADHVTVIARIVEEKSTSAKWSKITNPKITIVGSSNFRFEGIREEVEKSDRLIVRLPSFLGIQVLNINRNFKKPYAIEMVGCPWGALWDHSIKGKVAALPMMLATKLFVKKAKYVLYVTNEFLQKMYPTNGVTVGCSNVLIKMRGDSVLQNRLDKIRNYNGKIILGTAAALNVKYKGQKFVIRALSELKKQGITNYEYQMIGNGDASKLINEAQKNNVKDQVKIIGQINHDKVFEWLESIDVYVQPSLQEGLPRAVIEAMSYGLPCMGSDVAGIPELIDESMLFKKGNSHEIAKILKNLNKEKMLEFSEKNFEKAKSFDKKILDKRRHDFYMGFLKNGN